MRPHGLLILALALFAQTAWPAALVDIDHIPVAVRDLDQAVKDFQALGFAIKPGRAHANGLRNSHIKFADGAGLELISPTDARDELSAFYVNHLRQGEGPAFVAFHARDLERVEAGLKTALVAFEREGNTFSFKDPALAYLFIVDDNRSPSDRPEHFVHANGAHATREVRLATDQLAPLRQLFTALGASIRTTPTATIFELGTGRVVVRPARHQLLAGRPILGVVMAASGASTERIAPPDAHGLAIELRRDP